MDSLIADRERIPEIPGLTRRSLLAGTLGGLFVCGARGDGPAIVTSKNRIQSPACTLAPEQTEGPYYIDGTLIRSDITEGRPGIPLRLRIVALDGQRCKAIQNAAVSIWHCDASGIYSGFTANNQDAPQMPDEMGPGMPPGMGILRGHPPGPPPPGFDFRGEGRPPRPFDRRSTDETRFFRGIQLTDGEGIAEFITIYPGWYVGRDTHIHMKVQTSGSASKGTYQDGHVCHTAQLFFPDELSDAVAHLSPYSSHKTERTRQENDDVFTSQNGREFLLIPKPNNSRSMIEGFTAETIIAVDLNAEPEPVGFGGGPRPFMR